MKRFFRLVVGALLLVSSHGLAAGAEIEWAWLFSENRAYDPSHFVFSPESPFYNGTARWFMEAGAGTSEDPDQPVRVISAPTGDYELSAIGLWCTEPHLFAATFTEGSFPAPGAEWENQTYTFTAGGSPYLWEIPPGSLRALPIPEVSISGDINPTISWQPVQGADYYAVEIFPLTKEGEADLSHPLFCSERIEGFSFTYTGDLFRDGERYAIRVEAREEHPYAGTDPHYASGVINRSCFITKHPAFPPPQFDLATVRSYRTPGVGEHMGFYAIITGPSPEDVVSCQVSGPSGTFDLTPRYFIRQLGLLWGATPEGILPNGTYTFGVTDTYGRTASVSKDFSYNPSVPSVDPATMSPTDGAYVGTTTPTLSFAPAPGAGGYYVLVEDLYGGVCWYFSEYGTETSVTVPEGMLQPNTAYRWWARSVDDIEDTQNVVLSEARFYTGTRSGPTLGGIYTMSAESPEWVLNWFGAWDLGLAPWDIARLTVTGPFLGPLDLDRLDYRLYRSYYHCVSIDTPYPMGDGTYTYELEDNEGQQVTREDFYEYDPIPPIDDASLVPLENTYFDTTTPTFSWAPIVGPGPYTYILRIEDYNHRVKCTGLTTTGNSVTVPESTQLLRGCSYRWRVYAHNGRNFWFSSPRTFTINREARANHAPERPVLTAPANGAVDVSLTPALQTAPYSDPDPFDVHLRTEWMVSPVSDFSDLAFHETSSTHLTSITVPQFALEEGSLYYWKVRFYDKHMEASPWSEVFSFTTLQTYNDLNENGIPDDQENPEVDLNQDGIPDLQQTDVIKSFNTQVGEGQMGASAVDSPAVETLEKVEAVDPQTISQAGRPYDMPLGVFALRAQVKEPGDEAEVTVYFSQPAPPDARWYLYDSVDGWVDYSSHVTFSTDRTSARVRVKDGGYGDADKVANRVIADPGGFGLASWIHGRVYDAETEQGVSNARVSLADVSLATDDEGYYLGVVMPGTYTILVEAQGYDQLTASGVQIPEGGDLVRDFAIMPRALQPEAVTEKASSITLHGATLNGRVHPHGGETLYCFEYGPTQAYGFTTAEQSAGGAREELWVNCGVGGLAAGTTYHYRIVARNSAGVCYGGDRTFTTAVSAPEAEFTAEPTSGQAPLLVSFIDLSTGQISSWAWDFGDGNTSQEQNPQHSYGSGGIYTVALTVSGPGGADTETKEGLITVSGWAGAYKKLFDSDAQVNLFRRFRDEKLRGAGPSCGWVRSLYQHSGDALQVLLENPSLMARARRLIQINSEAISLVLEGRAAEIRNTDEIARFLTDFAEKARGGPLSSLARVVAAQLRCRKAEGEGLLGMELR